MARKFEPKKLLLSSHAGSDEIVAELFLFRLIRKAQYVEQRRELRGVLSVAAIDRYHHDVVVLVQRTA